MEEQDNSYKTELIIGVVLTAFAAVMAICDLGAGKYGDDEMIANQKQTEAFSWYQSKSIKQTLAEGQKDMLEALIKTNAISSQSIAGVDTFVLELKGNIAKYKKEKDEILKGSTAVGKENWAQDIDGEFGKVKGAAEWKSEAEVLGNAGDVFDTATLFLQMCIVFGAAGLIFKNPKTQWAFFVVMVGLGCIGTFFTVQAFMAV